MISRRRFCLEQQVGEFICGHGLANQIALKLIAPSVPQDCRLAIILDAFGRHGDVKSRCQGHSRTKNVNAIGVLFDASHKRSIDLHAIKAELPQGADAGISATEVVEREPDADAPKLVDRAAGLIGVCHQHTFRYLERKAVWIEVGLPEDRDHLCGELRIAKLDW